MTAPPHKFILLAEDDAVVAQLVLHTLATMTPAPTVVHVRDGVEAMDFLAARGAFAQREPGNPTLVLGANAYVVKPVEFRRFAFILQQLETFWLGINHPPPDQPALATVADMQ